MANESIDPGATARSGEQSAGRSSRKFHCDITALSLLSWRYAVKQLPGNSIAVHAP